MIKRFLLFICFIVLLTGCRGWRTDKPPVHPNVNFDFQPKIKAQYNPLSIPEETSQYKTEVQPPSLKDYDITESFIRNGQKNYNIYCASCHTKSGNGTKSIISQNGWVVSNILDKITQDKPDEEIFNIIKYGIRSMPGYGKKIDNQEIWQIVLYVKSLQKVETATKSEIKRLRKNNDN